MNELADAIRRKRGTYIPPVTAPVPWDSLLPDLVAGVVERRMRDLTENLRPQLYAIAEQLFNTRLDELRGPEGSPGRPGINAPEIDLDGIARKAATLVRMPTPEEIARKVKVPPLNPKQIAADAARLIEVPSEERIIAHLKEELAAIDAMQEETEEAAEKKITVADVDGLDALIKNMQRMMRDATRDRGGGGGVGQPQHESTVVTSATTQITTNFRVSAQGRAIWMNYNGQELFRGRHYSVPTDQKTFPLLFVPDDPTPGQNNVIDVIYFRT